MENLNLVHSEQRISNRIVNLYNEYIESGWSSRIPMWNLRENFSEIIPYEDPWFHNHFSVFACDAIANNRINGRLIYNIGGDPPLPHIHIRDTIPWIVPAPDQEQPQHHQKHQPDQINQQNSSITSRCKEDLGKSKHNPTKNRTTDQEEERKLEETKRFQTSWIPILLHLMILMQLMEKNHSSLSPKENKRKQKNKAQI